MLTIWGRTNSVNVQKALFAALHLQLPFERIDAGGQFGVNDTDAYRAMNPNGLVPTIDDGGVVVWESGAIVRYLCARYGAGGVWSTDPAARAQADCWADWQAQFSRAVGPAFLNLVRTPVETRDARAIEQSRAATEAEVATLDGHLAQNAWLAGASFTYAEFVVGPLLHRWLNMPVERAPRPHVERWYAALMDQAGARQALSLPVT